MSVRLFSNVGFDDIRTLLSLCSVMHLKFVPKSHLFFTAGKDRKIKQWDADRFEHVQTLEVASARSARSCLRTPLPMERRPPAGVSGSQSVDHVSYSGSGSCFFSFQGHHQEIWCLAVSPNGDYVVSSSHDKSLRLWERTREPLILEEEREMVRASALVIGLLVGVWPLSQLKFSF